MEERDANDIATATRTVTDTDLDYGALTQELLASLRGRWWQLKKRETDLEIIDLRVVVPSHAAVVTASTSVAAVGLFSFRSSSLSIKVHSA